MVCNDGDVRLVHLEDDMENEGQVEYYSQWGLVYYDSWDSNDAKVIILCHQLGYNVEGELFVLVVHLLKYLLHGSVLATNRPIGRPPPLVATPNLLEVNCVGIKGDINECPQDDRYSCLSYLTLLLESYVPKVR